MTDACPTCCGPTISMASTPLACDTCVARLVRAARENREQTQQERN